MIIFAIPISCQVYTWGLKLEVCDKNDRLVFWNDAVESFNFFTRRWGGTSVRNGSICWVYIHRDVCRCTGKSLWPSSHWCFASATPQEPSFPEGSPVNMHVVLSGCPLLSPLHQIFCWLAVSEKCVSCHSFLVNPIKFIFFDIWFQE